MTLAIGLTLSLVAAELARAAPEPRSFRDVVEIARSAATRPHAAEALSAANRDWIKSLDYDQARSIRFRSDAGWRLQGGPFEVRAFHPGFVHRQPVHLHRRDGKGFEGLPFRPELFAYDLADPPPEPAAMAFAGFRVHHPFEGREPWDEVVAFLGASYFRAVGAAHGYGLSARAVAVNTATTAGTESFPAFTHFWLEAEGKDTLVILALLSGAHLTGAYRFSVHPGEVTRMRVEARLFRRAPFEQLGLAPLTSMFLFGESDRAAREDHRPEIHDSDGLVVRLSNGDRVFRPLQNPPRTTTSVFEAPKGVEGFGLVQRDRAFASYQDLETRQEKRPSAWVTPLEGFGAGRVVLLEIATQREGDDNVVTFFEPDEPWPEGRSRHLVYRLEWRDRAPDPPALEVVGTRRTRGPSGPRFVVDFAPRGGSGDARRDAEPAPRAVASTSEGGRIEEVIVRRHAPLSGWRVLVDPRRSRAVDVDLRLHLASEDRRLSETWIHRWYLEE